MTDQTLALLNWAVETAVVFAVVLAIAAASSRRLRVVLYRCAFVVALAAPLVLIPAGPKIGLFTVSAPVVAVDGRAFEPGRLVARAIARAPNDRGRGATLQAASWLTMGLAAAWLAGFLVVVAGYIASLARLSRAFADGQAPPAQVAARFEVLRRRLGVGPAVRLRLSDRIATPCTFGWLRPKVLAPMDFAASPETVDAVLAHELCHVRADDALWIMAGRLACATHWFNPLLRACERRHRDDIEIVCDDAVVETTMEAGAYVEALARIARRMVAPPLGAGVTMSALGIVPRLRLLLTRGRPLPRPALWLRAAIYGAGAAMLALLATTQVVAARPAAASPAVAMAVTDMAAAIEPRIPPLKPGEGRLYLDVADGVTVWARSVGFMCDGARCVATVARDSRLKLTASTLAPVRLRWAGCAPVEDGRACFVQVPHGPAQVTVRLAG